ncbi:MAG: hypothetical protein ACOYN6_06640 [Ignavibacteria bacterium]
MFNDTQFIKIFGEEASRDFNNQQRLFIDKQVKLDEIDELKQKAASLFNITNDLVWPRDYLVSILAGVILGSANAIFKNYISVKRIKGGKTDFRLFGDGKHEHEVTRTIIDAKAPKLPGMKFGNDMHRQIGPFHDRLRQTETLELLSGNVNDYNIWGKKASEIIGHPLSSMRNDYSKFIDLGGFKIPNDPKKELANHLFIDFFSSRSNPIPGTTFIGDAKPEYAKVLLGMYDEGFNEKNTYGNLVGYFLLEIIIRGYTLLFKAIPQSGFSIHNINKESIGKLFKTYKDLKNSNGFYAMMMMAHGSSFLCDTLITTGTKNYAGIFQLNYASLIAFSKYLFQYLIKNYKEYMKLMKEVKAKKIEIYDIDNKWLVDINNSIARSVSDPNYLSIFDNSIFESQNEWLINSQTEIIDMVSEEKKLIDKLKGTF